MLAGVVDDDPFEDDPFDDGVEGVEDDESVPFEVEESFVEVDDDFEPEPRLSVL